ncbi:MAG: aminoglycoside phosphotransferase [Gammaproteobacteria bacterium]|nr:MAG: aminoglycoside phosphotransferase [Gammaproteobacteria bacterium]
MSDRTEQISQWLKSHGYDVKSLEAASSDASFRRYLRVDMADGSRIVMDAPPENKDCRPFVDVARALFNAGLNVPEILEEDIERGFLLLGDLGDRLYLDELNEETVERLYGDAIGALLAMQASGPHEGEIPPYDRELLMQEMELFRAWFLQKHLQLELDDLVNQMLDISFDLLAENALEQPQVCVHRDYHSRNLMLTETNNPGILDFQDAVFGPVTYDLVSLLRDCYIAWPREQVEDWVLGFHDLAMQSGILNRDLHYDEKQFLRWFDLMGVQRHLKAIGIFARLNHRDGKSGYLKDIPRTLNYVEEVSSRYEELEPLYHYIISEVKSVMVQR